MQNTAIAANNNNIGLGIGNGNGIDIRQQGANNS